MEGLSGFTKSKRSALLLAVFLGWLGGHRFYLGYPHTGLAMMFLTLAGIFTLGLTLPLVALWVLIDVAAIAFGALSDSEGYPLA